MKRIFVILLTLVLLLGICPMSALAETGGSGNVDGGGGDMGQGTSQNSWNPGMDGVRITVVDAESGQAGLKSGIKELSKDRRQGI